MADPSGEAPASVPPTSAPTLIYDAQSPFARRAVRRWRDATGDAVVYLPAADPGATDLLGEASLAPGGLVLVDAAGARQTGAAAVLGALAHQPGGSWLHRVARRWSPVAAVTEVVFRALSAIGRALAPLIAILVGRDLRRTRYQLVRWIYLRALAVVAAIAFLSFWTQIGGLVSSKGITPADEHLESTSRWVERTVTTHFAENRKLTFPKLEDLVLGDKAQTPSPHDRYRLTGYSLYWLHRSDGMLHALCAIGLLASVLLLLGFLPGFSLLTILICYLSLSGVSSPWLGYQWDVLLIETCFVSLFFAPWGVFPRLRPGARAAPRSGLWLIRLLLLKLMVLSAVVKLYANSPPWDERTALTYHYWTQPLPLWSSWYAHHLPLWLHKLSCSIMLFIELVVPFSMFGPRRVRYAGFWLLVLLQVAILTTGNYGYFNLLTLVLCLSLLDDGFFQRFAERERDTGRWDRYVLPLYGWAVPLAARLIPARARTTPRPRLPAVRIMAACFAVLLGWLSYVRAMQTVDGYVERDRARREKRRLEPKPPSPGWAERFLRRWRPLRLINSYGLFANMTTTRREIQIEGSVDGIHWRTYRFEYKPGDPARAPPFAWFHLPRLDWQMWFAALQGSCMNRRARWYQNLLRRLLAGEKRVLALFANNPFPQGPPRYIRSRQWEYRFSAFDRSERRTKRQGRWWQRRALPRPFCPTVALRDGKLVRVGGRPRGARRP